MSAIFHHIIRQLREALGELYEAAYAAQEWLEEGSAFLQDAGKASSSAFDFRPQPQPQKS